MSQRTNQLIDMTGQAYGDFLIVYHISCKGWLLRCQTCGAERLVKGGTLRNGLAAQRCQPCAVRQYMPYLTNREDEIAKMVAAGLFNKEIAQKLAISYQTVKNILHQIYGKYGFTTRMELAKMVWKVEGN